MYFLRPDHNIDERNSLYFDIIVNILPDIQRERCREFTRYTVMTPPNCVLY